MNRSSFIIVSSLFLFACSEETGKSSTSGTNPPDNPGASLEVPVQPTGRTYVALKEPAIVTPTGDATMDTSWDLAFENYEVFTNSGVSGMGEGGAFGPLDRVTYDEGTAPTIPFLTSDETGGPFRDYWAYDPSVHVLWVRYHVFGVRDKDKLWKVQILGYYADQQGAPVAAIYRLRWAEVTATGPGTTQELADIDGTAGGSEAPADAPNECLDLGTGARVMHTSEQARTASDWHLCFRRATISVNGELGGPRGVTAVDLNISETKDETLDIVKKRTAETELARFDAIGHAEITASNLVWRGDRVFSAFSDYWVDPVTNPPTLIDNSWLVQSADGAARYLLVFDHFDGASATTPGKITLKVRPDGGWNP